MSQEQLLHGMRWLASRLYSPAAFGERMVRFIQKLGPPRNRGHSIAHLTYHLQRRVERNALRVAVGVARMGGEEARMTGRLLSAVARKPSAAGFVVAGLFRYRQIRHMYDIGHIWDRRLAEEAAPFA
jgi:hypothetical protein